MEDEPRFLIAVQWVVATAAAGMSGILVGLQIYRYIWGPIHF